MEKNRKNGKAISDLIAAEEEKLAKLISRKEDLETRIKNSRANLDKYKMIQNNVQFSVLSEALGEVGIGFDDIIAALSEGDVLSLQEKIERAQSEQTQLAEMD